MTTSLHLYHLLVMYQSCITNEHRVRTMALGVLQEIVRYEGFMYFETNRCIIKV